MEYTTIYKVYGCNDEGRRWLDSEFFSFKSACQYAAAQYGKIHSNMPEVVKYIYCYDPETKSVEEKQEEIPEAQIYYMNKI